MDIPVLEWWSDMLNTLNTPPRINHCCCCLSLYIVGLMAYLKCCPSALIGEKQTTAIVETQCCLTRKFHGHVGVVQLGRWLVRFHLLHSVVPVVVVEACP